MYHVCAVALRPEEGISFPGTAVVSHQIWVLGIDLQVSPLKISKHS